MGLELLTRPLNNEVRISFFFLLQKSNIKNSSNKTLHHHDEVNSRENIFVYLVSENSRLMTLSTLSLLGLL